MKKMIIVLTGVMILSGLVLAATYGGLTDRIEANRVAALNASLAAIFEGQASAEAIDFEQLEAEDQTIYRASAGGDVLGYAVRIQTPGYGGPITMLVGLSPNTEEIIGISVVEQVETPGLGGNITQEAFRGQFEELSANEPITYVKNVDPMKEDNQVQALSGATITSEAVVDGINEHLGGAREIIARQDQ